MKGSGILIVNEDVRKIQGSGLKWRKNKSTLFVNVFFPPFPFRVRESFRDSLQGKNTLNRLFNKNPDIIAQLFLGYNSPNV